MIVCMKGFKRCGHAVTLQWDKLRRSGALPHLGRWFELVSTEALLKEVAEKYGPKKPSSRQEFRKELAAAGMGGGGQQPPIATSWTQHIVFASQSECILPVYTACGAHCEGEGNQG